jgi:hypothetical protein
LYQNVQPASERVAPDVADELRRDHFTVLRQAIAETGGRLHSGFRDSRR